MVNKLSNCKRLLIILLDKRILIFENLYINEYFQTKLGGEVFDFCLLVC